MKWLTVVLALPLCWAAPALAQDDDDSPPPEPTPHRAIAHSTAPDSTDDDLAPKPKAPLSAPVIRPLPGPVKQSSPPVGSEEGDDLLGPAPAKATPAKSAAKAAKPKPKSAKELKREAKEARLQAQKERAAKARAAKAAASQPSPAVPMDSASDSDEAAGPTKVIHHAATSDDDSDELIAPPSKTAKRKADVPRAKRTSAATFDFDLLPEEKQVSAAEQLRLESSVSTRRSMLEWHQGLGIATAGLMVGTVILGQLSFSDKFGGNGNSGTYEIWHSGFEAATVVAFLSAGALAIFAPVPYEKKGSHVDTVTVHKYSMLIATIGMATEVPLGIVTVAREGYADQAALAVSHLIIGYITAAALGTGATALFF